MLSHSPPRPRHHLVLAAALAILMAAALAVAPSAQARGDHHGRDPGDARASTFVRGAQPS